MSAYERSWPTSVCESTSREHEWLSLMVLDNFSDKREQGTHHAAF